MVERTMDDNSILRGVVNRESSDCQVLLNGKPKPLVFRKQLLRPEKAVIMLK
jgi:hypothetical protein